jgi:hypothetical protein
VQSAYRRALFAGAFPLAVGISIFLLWVATRWDALMVAGLLTLFGGLVFFAVGLGLLVRYCWLGLRAPDVPRRRVWLRTAACGALLLSNFPVAGGIVVAVGAIESCYTVVVRNDSTRPLEGVRVEGGGCYVSFGTIAAGDTMRRWMWAERDGTLVLHVAGVPDRTIAYVTNGLGGHTTFTFRSDGAVTVVDRD